MKKKSQMPKVKPTTGFLSPQDLVKYFGISLHSQARMRLRKRQENDKNPLPFIRVGKRILYNEIQIKEWLKRIQIENSVIYKNQ